MKLVFMGTPVYALSCLEALIGAGHEIAAVFTQPDKPKNRGKQIQMTPVKELALKHEIPVYQPLSLRKGEDAEKSLEVLKEIAPECIVVVAYGQLLPESILELPKYGCINVHASLLPMYRGAAPIQRCIQFGEKKSGVTTMYMAKGLDTGDMILRDEVEIPETMTGSELHDKLAEMGGKLIVRTLEELQAGTAPRIPQEGETCYASMISKEELKLDFTKPAVQVRDFIRAMSAAPCGKSFTLAELMGNNGKLYSMDLHDMRVGLIEDGASRLGIRIITAMQNDASKFNAELPQADRVLCDVPCSGLGVIRRKPEIKFKSPSDFDGLPEIQYQILETSARYVKPGGTLVYSTCTLSRAENDEVAKRFAAAHPEFLPIVQPVPYAEAAGDPTRTYCPDENGGDGFFTASFRRVK